METQNFNSYLVRKLETVCNELQQIITKNSLLHVLLAMFDVILFPYTLVIPYRVSSFSFSRELKIFELFAFLISALMFW